MTGAVVVGTAFGCITPESASQDDFHEGFGGYVGF
jgi:hypothetical protein